VVADPLEVRVDLERRDEEPEVARDGLLGREEVDRALVDPDLEKVDRLVALDHGAGLRRVARDERLDRGRDLALGLGAHRDELAAQRLEALGKVFFHVVSSRTGASRGADAGSETVKRLPVPGSDSTRMDPPWRIRMCLTIARPRPVPGTDFARDGSTR
jgi:hypothetical protein